MPRAEGRLRVWNPMMTRDAEGCLFWLGMFVGLPIATAALAAATGLEAEAAPLLLFGLGAVILAVVALRDARPWNRRNRQLRAKRRQAKARAEAEAQAREARRCRPCASMDRATLIAHVAEFGTGFPMTRNDHRASRGIDLYRRRLAAGLTTEHLHKLCASINRGDWSTWSLPGEAGGWSVYRIQFADGAAYVGMTGFSVLSRIARHLGGDGSSAVRQHIKDGHDDYRFAVLASGLTEKQARERERHEIRALPRPLNMSIPRPPHPPRPAIDPARQVPVERILGTHGISGPPSKRFSHLDRQSYSPVDLRVPHVPN
ncbi:MAG: GIY-YIG nuclease family protein [Chloroflexota bacterium]|nr:GIY-YIG nuclease family protein [Chloroflexota bacterium]